jgi:hypothetical protein
MSVPGGKADLAVARPGHALPIDTGLFQFCKELSDAMTSFVAKPSELIICGSRREKFAYA